MITPSQKKAIERIQDKFFSFYSFGNPEGYEFKENTVKEYEHFVSLVLEVGMKEDEGTLASWYCRDRKHFFIGKRGKVTVMNEKHKLVKDKLFY